MKNVFVFERDNNNKFNRELKIKKHLNVEYTRIKETKKKKTNY